MTIPPPPDPGALAAAASVREGQHGGRTRARLWRRRRLNCACKLRTVRTRHVIADVGLVGAAGELDKYE